MTVATRLPSSLSLIGILGLVVALAWWLLVFRVVVSEGYMPTFGAVKCLASSAFACELAMSLCTTDHLFGITRYYPDLFLLAATLLTAGLTLRLLRRG